MSCSRFVLLGRKSEGLPQRELEDFLAVHVAGVQGLGEAEGQRSEAAQPGDAYTGRVTQFVRIDVKAVELRSVALGVEHVADIEKEGGAQAAAILDERQREQQLGAALDQRVAAEGRRALVLLQQVEFQLAGLGIQLVAELASVGPADLRRRTVFIDGRDAAARRDVPPAASSAAPGC
jgi:hypothetical protein